MNPPQGATQRRTILVADDDPFIRDLLDAVLDDTGFDIRHARDGAEALELALAMLPDVVLLDVMMPGLDGYEVCRALRGDPRFNRTRIIMLTARNSSDDRAASMSAGADAFFTKPFSPLALIESLTTAGRGVA
jgi:CheY-like chemotaxis protein